MTWYKRRRKRWDDSSDCTSLIRLQNTQPAPWQWQKNRHKPTDTSPSSTAVVHRMTLRDSRWAFCPFASRVGEPRLASLAKCSASFNCCTKYCSKPQTIALVIVGLIIAALIIFVVKPQFPHWATQLTREGQNTKLIRQASIFTEMTYQSSC